MRWHRTIQSFSQRLARFSRAAATAVAQCVLDAVKRPISIDGVQLCITLSAGVGLAAPGDDADAVIAKADQALYSAKGTGRDRVVA